MAVDVSIVIVTHNSQDMIDALLDSVSSALSSHTAEVIVVDNDSTDDTRDRVRARADCRLIAAANDGYSGGVNVGILASAPDVPVLVLNPDVRLGPGSVAALLAALGGRRGIIAPRMLDEQGHRTMSLRREPTLPRALGLTRLRWALLSEYVQESRAYEQAGAVDWAVGAALLLSPECLADVGAWDESFFLYSEETDYCLRARDRGWQTWYEPAAEVVHIGGQSGQSDQIHAMQVINRVRLYRRRHSLPASWTYFALTALSELSWVARGSARSRFALRSMFLPSTRPAQLGASRGLMPR